MEQLPPSIEPRPEAPAPPPTALPSRLLNVLAAPGEVFDEVKTRPPVTANWLAPVILAALVGIIASFAMFSQPAIQQQIREQQAKAMDERVRSGKMTQEDADRAMTMVEKYS